MKVKDELKSQSETKSNDNGSVARPVEMSARPVKPHYKVRQLEGEDAWGVWIEMPGVKRENIVISFEDGLLDVRGERTDSVPESWRPLNYHAVPQDYHLQLRIAETIDTEKISAKLTDGVLNLHLPTSDLAKPRTIAVK
ncbi:MAG: Hsp20/alpha crystallin family protein [Verrucomicrobiales bacterium]|nr:Hsp20/alpha crystallin family protein [Verrucomicrobiales bacterium]